MTNESMTQSAYLILSRVVDTPAEFWYNYKVHIHLYGSREVIGTLHNIAKEGYAKQVLEYVKDWCFSYEEIWGWS